MAIWKLVFVVALVPARAYSQPTAELDPFTFADFSWQSGNARTKDSLLGNPVA